MQRIPSTPFTCSNKSEGRVGVTRTCTHAYIACTHTVHTHTHTPCRGITTSWCGQTVAFTSFATSSSAIAACGNSRVTRTRLSSVPAAIVVVVVAVEHHLLACTGKHCALAATAARHSRCIVDTNVNESCHVDRLQNDTITFLSAHRFRATTPLAHRHHCTITIVPPSAGHKARLFLSFG